MKRRMCPECRKPEYRQAIESWSEPSLRPSWAEIVTGLLLFVAYVGFVYAAWSLGS